jgi:Tfp pilus assembly protein PilF
LSDLLCVSSPPAHAGGTDNVEAYDAYLRGRSLAAITPNIDVGRAIELLEHAVELDPEFAEAWLALASSYALTRVMEPSAEARAELRAAADNARQRAVESAPDLWETHVSLAWALAVQGRWVEANSAYERAYALAAEAGADMRQHGWTYRWETGRLEEALAYLETTRRVDPLSPTIGSAADNLLYSLGRRAEPSAAEDGPSLGVRLARAIEARDENTVDALLNVLLERNPLFNRGIAALRPVWRSPEEALAAIREAALGSAELRSTAEFLFSALLAAVYDDAELSVMLLRAAFIDGEGELGRSFMWLPEMRDVRATDAFKTLMRDLGLVDLWRTTGNWGDFCRPVGADDFECS